MLRRAIVTLSTALEVFKDDLVKLSQAGRLERARVALKANPLESEWHAVDDASMELQRAIGLQSCVNIDHLTHGQQDMQTQLVFIAAQIIEIKQMRQEKGDTTNGLASSPSLMQSHAESSPVLRADDIAVGVEMVSRKSRPASSSDSEPPSPASPPNYDQVSGQDMDNASVVLGSDPFLEALLARYVNMAETEAASKRELQSRLERVQIERDQAREQQAQPAVQHELASTKAQLASVVLELQQSQAEVEKAERRAARAEAASKTFQLEVEQKLRVSENEAQAQRDALAVQLATAQQQAHQQEEKLRAQLIEAQQNTAEQPIDDLRNNYIRSGLAFMESKCALNQDLWSIPGGSQGDPVRQIFKAIGLSLPPHRTLSV